MNHAQYVGRVGALAVALGIGTAVASGGVAQASTGDTTESDGSTTTGPPSHHSTHPRFSGLSGREKSDPPTSTAGTGETQVVSAADDPDKPDSRRQVRPPGHTSLRLPGLDQFAGTHVRHRQVDTQDAEDPQTVLVGAKDEEEAASAKKVTPPIDTSSASQPLTTRPTRTQLPLRSLNGPIRVKVTDVAKSLPAVTFTGAFTRADVTGADAPTITTADTRALAPTIAPVPTATRSPIRFVLNALSAVGLRPDAFPPGTPLAPIGSLLELVYAGLRRVDHALFNQSPVATPLVTGTDPKTGVVTGRVATDPDDPLQFTEVSGPEHGTVVYHPDGTFTYTPDLDQVHPVGQTDSFTVEVSDAGSGPHLHLLGAGHTTTVTVSLTVATHETVTKTVDGLEEFQNQLAISPDGSKIYIVSEGAPGHVQVINTSDNTLVKTIVVGSNPNDVAFNPQTQFAYVPTNESSTTAISVINTDTDTVDHTITTGIPQGIDQIAVTSDGTKAYILASNGLSVMDLDTEAVTLVHADTRLNGDLVLSADEQYAYIAVFGDKKVDVVKLSDGSLVKEIDVNQFPDDLVLGGDGRLYVNDVGEIGDDATVSVISPDGSVQTAAPPDSRGMVLSKDGSRLYVANINFDTISVIDTATLQVVSTITGVESPWRLGLSPDGSTLYAIGTGTSDNLYVIPLLQAA